MTQIDPRYVPHSVAIAARDALIRDTLDGLDGTLNHRVETLAAALSAHRALYWSRERFTGPGDNASQRHLILHTILKLDRGRALCSWQLRKIAEAEQRHGVEDSTAAPAGRVAA
jgi:hypothetical protein